MAERNVTVNVDIKGTGNLPQTTAAANAQVAKLQQTTKGAAQAAGQLASAQQAAGTAIAATGNAASRAGTGGGGTGGRGLGGFVERVGPGMRSAGLVGAAGLAAAYGGIQSASPEAGSQVANSFRMIANEIGIATIPAATRFSGVLQNLSYAIRDVNEQTNGWAGSLAFTGALALSSVGALGVGLSALKNVVGGLRWAGLIGAGGQAAAAAGGAATGQAAAGGAGGGGLLAAGGAATFVVTAAVASVATAIADSVYSAGAARRAQEEGFRPRAGQEEQYALYRSLLRIPAVSTGVSAVQSIMNARNPEGAFPVHGLGAWLAEQIGLGAAGPGQGPEDVTERHPVIHQSAEDLYNAMLVRVQGTPAALAGQESRALEALQTALNQNTAALMANSAAGQQMASWGVPAGENG